MPRMIRLALVTGGTKGIGYYVGKEIVKRIPTVVCYMTSRDDDRSLTCKFSLIRQCSDVNKKSTLH